MSDTVAGITKLFQKISFSLMQENACSAEKKNRKTFPEKMSKTFCELVFFLKTSRK